MGRTRPKTRKVKPIVTPNTAEGPSTAPSIPALLEKAQSLIVQCDYELAGRFARRILECEPGNVEAKEILGVTQLETGELDAAKEVCLLDVLYITYSKTDHGSIDIDVSILDSPTSCRTINSPTVRTPLSRSIE